MNGQSTENFQGGETILYDSIMVDTCHYTFVKTHGMCTKSEANVNYGLWVIKMCQYRFLICNKYTTLVQEVDRRGGCTCVEVEGIWELSILSAQFCCESKSAFKKK